MMFHDGTTDNSENQRLQVARRPRHTSVMSDVPALIEIHKLGREGGTLLNKINSISRGNPQYADRLTRGMDLLEEASYGLP